MTNLVPFNQIAPLTVGEFTAKVKEGVCIKIEDTEDFDEDGILDSIFLESVEEARALRDWLNKALPDEPRLYTGPEYVLKQIRTLVLSPLAYRETAKARLATLVIVFQELKLAPDEPSGGGSK